VETETVTATASGTTLTATFKNPAFEPQTKTVEAPAGGPADKGRGATGEQNTTKPTGSQAGSKTPAIARAAALPKTGDATTAMVASLLVAGTSLLLVGKRRARA
jgi:LPXTG-motif cell wall-anchored protein